MIVAPALVRDQCQFWVRKIPTLVAPEVTSRKKQFEIIHKRTGINPRRVKDYWRGVVNDPPGSQARTIEAAYRAALQRWKQSALDQLQVIEAEHEDTIRDVLGYSAARWQDVAEAGSRDRRNREETTGDNTG